jgi:short-subunit dehydrogenase
LWHRAIRTRQTAVIANIREQLAMIDAPLDFIPLDLASYTSVHAFVDQFHERQLPLHLLINNGGVSIPDFQLTKDGEELQFGTKY